MLKNKFDEILLLAFPDSTIEQRKEASSLLFEEVINWVHKTRAEETLLHVEKRLYDVIYKVATRILEEVNK